jgi:hypothetical protein
MRFIVAERSVPRPEDAILMSKIAIHTLTRMPSNDGNPGAVLAPSSLDAEPFEAARPAAEPERRPE